MFSFLNCLLNVSYILMYNLFHNLAHQFLQYCILSLDWIVLLSLAHRYLQYLKSPFWTSQWSHYPQASSLHTTEISSFEYFNHPSHHGMDHLPLRYSPLNALLCPLTKARNTYHWVNFPVYCLHCLFWTWLTTGWTSRLTVCLCLLWVWLASFPCSVYSGDGLPLF